MILENQKQSEILETDFSEDTISMSLDLDSAQVLMQMLSKGLYSDQIGSTIRETASNALDSHRRTNTDTPIIVSIVQNDNGYEFTVEDFGSGLDADDIENIISKYGKSSKRNSATEIGMFGLGFKAPLSYTSSFYFICRKDGIERKYMMYAGEDVNSIDPLYETATNEKNGVKIIVPIKESDVLEFKNKIKSQLCYFENVYFNVNNINNDFNIIRDEHYQYSELNEDNTLHICLDNVYYPLDYSKLDIDMLFIPIGLRFNLSDGLFPTPNRETLIYTPKTKQLILNKIKIVAELFINKYNSTTKETRDIYLAINCYKTESRYLNLTKDVSLQIDSFTKHTTIKINYPKIKDVDLLDLKSVYSHTNNYWLGEFDCIYRRETKFIRDCKKNFDYDFNVNRIDSNSKIYYYTEKITALQKDYLADINSSQYRVVLKHNHFKLKGNYDNSYSHILKLKTHPKHEWRQRIKEFQHVISLCTEHFINLDELVIPKEFIDRRKNGKIVNNIYVPKIPKKNGEITGKIAKQLLKWNGNNCKWASENINLDKLSTQSYLHIYGSEEDKTQLDQLYSVTNPQQIKIIIFSQRELTKVANLKIHNLVEHKKFMKGETKPYKRIVTAYLINQLINEHKHVFDNHKLDEISKDLFDKMNTLKSYKESYYISSNSEIIKVMLKLAEQNNLFDEEIYYLYKEILDVLQKLPFLKTLLRHSYRYSIDEDVKQCIIDLCKYHKYKVNLDLYNIKLTETIITEEELTQLEEA